MTFKSLFVVARPLRHVIVAACVVGTLHAAGPQPSVFRSGIELVRVHVTVTGHDGRLITTLAREDFEVWDNGKPQPIIAFDNTPQPILLMLLLDVSGSMYDNLALMRVGVEQLFVRLRPDDLARVSTFGRTVTVSPAFTNDLKELRAALPTAIPVSAPTPLWFAVDEAMEVLEHAGNERRVVLVLSDGRDNVSSVYGSLIGNYKTRSFSQADVTARAQKDDVMVYAVGLHSSGPSVRGNVFVPDPELARVALVTGGGYLEVQAGKDLESAFARVADELHSQYIVGFEPPSQDGQVHTIEVRVRQPGTTARARRNYVAPTGSR